MNGGMRRQRRPHAFGAKPPSTPASHQSTFRMAPSTAPRGTMMRYTDSEPHQTGGRRITPSLSSPGPATVSALDPSIGAQAARTRNRADKSLWRTRVTDPLVIECFATCWPGWVACPSEWSVHQLAAREVRRVCQSYRRRR